MPAASVPTLSSLWSVSAVCFTIPLIGQGRRNRTSRYNCRESSSPMPMRIRPEDVLDYHSSAPAGKVSVTPTKPCHTQRDLSLAYTPGVAIPCKEIERDPSLAYKYTAKGNLVAVISNGSAVLGLGNIGALAGKPVMEGKGVLFKR